MWIAIICLEFSCVHPQSMIFSWKHQWLLTLSSVFFSSSYPMRFPICALRITLHQTKNSLLLYYSQDFFFVPSLHREKICMYTFFYSSFTWIGCAVFIHAISLLPSIWIIIPLFQSIWWHCECFESIFGLASFSSASIYIFFLLSSLSFRTHPAKQNACFWYCFPLFFCVRRPHKKKPWRRRNILKIV